VIRKIRKLTKSFSPSSNISTQPNLLRKWRQTALDWVLRAVFIFATPVLILGIVNILQDYHQGYSLTQSLGLGMLYIVVYILTIIITFVSRFNLHFRVGSLVFILFGIGLAHLLAGGLSSDGLLVIFAAIALSSIFYDFRRTLIVQILGMVVVVVVAWLLVSEMMVIDPKLQANSGNLASWIVRGLLLALLSTALVLATNYLVTSFERSLSSLQKQTEHLSSLQETTLDILAHKKMGDLLDSLIKRAADLVNADGGVFFLVDQNEENLTMMGGRGKEKNQLRKKIRRGTGVAGRVLESKEPLIVPDYSQWPEREAEEEPYWGSISQVPVFLNEKVIGVLGCYTLAGNLRIFSQDDLFIIEGLARQAAVAIENINLIDAAQQAEAKLEAIVQAAPSAIISADREQHIIMFNKAAENMFGYSADEIMDKDANLLLPMRFHDSHPKYVDEFTNKTSNENAILIPRELVGLRANGEEFPVEVSVSKVDNKGKMILTVIMQDITERKQTQDALRESEAYTRMLLEFSRDLELSQTYQDILVGALGITKKTIGYENIWFYLISDDKKEATLLGAIGNKAAEITELIPVLPMTGDQYLEEISRGLGPVVVEDAHSDPRVNRELIAHLGNRSIVNIPVTFLGHQLGTLGMGSFDEEGVILPTQAQLDFLSTMASHIAVSIDRITQTQERARAEAEIIRNNQNQKIINTLLQSSLKNIPLYQILEHALGVILSTPWLSVLPRGAIFLIDENNSDLKMVAQRNLSEDLQITCAIVKSGICLCGRAGEKKETLFSTSKDLEHETHIDGEEPHSHYNVPIILGDKLQGLFVLYLSAEHLRDEKEVEFLTAVANTLAGLIDRVKAQERIKRINADLILAYDSTLEGWAKALELRDKETGDHTLRVAEITVALARAIGLPESELAHIWRGALLHDIGKMSIPDATLKKEGSLNKEEWKIMRQHPQNAYDMLSSIPYLKQALDIPYCHHEKWDGSGYPHGLKGEEIPLSARMFSVVDVWDALRSDRPYRSAWDERKVVGYIRERAGIEFDAQIVDAFFKLIAQ